MEDRINGGLPRGTGYIDGSLRGRDREGLVLAGLNGFDDDVLNKSDTSLWIGDCVALLLTLNGVEGRNSGCVASSLGKFSPGSSICCVTRLPILNGRITSSSFGNISSGSSSWSQNGSVSS